MQYRSYDREGSGIRYIGLRRRVISLLFSICVASVCVTAFADTPAPLSPQTIKLPDGPSSLKGLGESFSANIATGTGSYVVPIQVPPGHLAPRVALTYNGGTGKTAVGLGWDLPVVQIYRTTDKGLPDYDQYDGFAVKGGSFNDELVSVNPERGYYRLKNDGSHALFIWNQTENRWTIRLENGQSYELGSDRECRQSVPGKGTYRWLIRYHRDQFGHRVEYIYREYMGDDGQLYLGEIRYAPGNRVAFIYEPRPDTFRDYSYGSLVQTSRRLKTIEIYHNESSNPLRYYELSYREDELVSLLLSVQMIVPGESDQFRPLRFDYWEDDGLGGEVVTMVNTPFLSDLLLRDAELEDVNGDALPDVLVGRKGQYLYYENRSGKGFARSSYDINDLVDAPLGNENVLLADMDGDGNRDVIQPWKSPNGVKFYRGGDVREGRFLGFDSGEVLEDDTGEIYWGTPKAKLIDLNSDGRTDLLTLSGGRVRKIINDPRGYLKEEILPRDDNIADVCFSGCTDPAELVEFNGDGQLDLVQKHLKWSGDGGFVRVWYGKGQGYFTRSFDMLNVPQGRDDEFYFSDVNRDGQADLVEVSGTRINIYYNRGNLHFTERHAIENHNVPPTWEVDRIWFVDMNGNGSRDLVWLIDDPNGSLSYLDLMNVPQQGLLKEIDNGLGYVTTIYYQPSTQFAIEAKYEGRPWRTTLPTPVPVISEVVSTDNMDKLGGPSSVSRITYDYRDGYFDGTEREFRGFGTVLTTTHGDKAQETKVIETRMHVGRNLETLEDEEVLKGKTWLQIERNARGEIYRTVENRWRRSWLCQEGIDILTKIELLPKCDSYADKELHKDDLVAAAQRTDHLLGSYEEPSDFLGGPKFSASHFEYDALGRVNREERYGEVRMPGHEPGDDWQVDEGGIEVGDDEAREETVYADNLDPFVWILGRVAEKKTATLSGEIASLSRVYYDGSDVAGEVGQRGLATKEVSCLEPGMFLGSSSSCERWIPVKTNTYNGDGLVVETRNALGHLTVWQYDDVVGLFPVLEQIHTENSLLEYTASWDAALGVLSDATDFNGNTTTYEYDGLGRLRQIIDPLGDVAKMFDYDLGTRDHPISTTEVETLVDRESGATRLSWIYTDGLGRTRSRVTEAEAIYGYIHTGWTELTPAGNEKRVFDPIDRRTFEFIAGAPARTPFTKKEYDGLGRPTKVTPPLRDGAKRATYSWTRYLPFETHVFDERDSAEGGDDYPAKTRVDGLGRVVEIVKRNDVEDLSAGKVAPKWMTWRVNYDTSGNIVGFTDPKGNTRRYAYDTLGRLTGLFDLNTGSVTFEYDDEGNLTRREDALGQVHTYSYGVDGRLRYADFYSGFEDALPAYSYTYHYDRPAGSPPGASPFQQLNVKGQVSWIEWPTGQAYFSYDEFGRVEKELQALWNPATSDDMRLGRNAFKKTYVYNAVGDVVNTAIYNGDGQRAEVSLEYNERSLVQSMSATIVGVQKAIVPQVIYDVRGMAVVADNGNETRSCAWYNDRAELVGIKTGPASSGACLKKGDTSGSAFQHLLYHRTPSGQIGEIEDLSAHLKGVPSLDAAYTYDRLYQLTDAQTSFGKIHYAYDEIQNIKARQVTAGGGDLLSGYWLYDDKRPNQLVEVVESLDPGAPKQRQYTYDAVGQMETYNGFDLTFDVEGRLVIAEKQGEQTQRYYYDHTGKRRIAVIEEMGKEPKINQYVFDDYQVRDGEETFLLDGGSTQIEVRQAEGVQVDLYTLNELEAYVSAADKFDIKQPLPSEYMNLNADDSADFDEDDLELARQSFGELKKVGGAKQLWRYYHKDHLGGTTHVSDDTGQVVSHLFYHPYGGTSHQGGLRPVFGFAGSENVTANETGLRQFGARWYAPDIGRWVSADPLYLSHPTKNIEKPFNSGLYVYAVNNPMNVIDPSGEEPPEETSYMSRDDGLDFECADPGGQSSTNPHLNESQRLANKHHEWALENSWERTGKNRIEEKDGTLTQYPSKRVLAEWENWLGRTKWQLDNTAMGEIGLGDKKEVGETAESQYHLEEMRAENTQMLNQMEKDGFFTSTSNTVARDAFGASNETAYNVGTLVNKFESMADARASEAQNHNTMMNQLNAANQMPRHSQGMIERPRSP